MFIKLILNKPNWTGKNTVKCKILAFHGFLGSPQDFDFLKSDFEVYTPDLNEYVHLPFDGLKAKLEHHFPIHECHLLGYSFGSRLALRLFDSFNISSQKIFCLAGHMGLASKILVHKRVPFELKMIKLLQKNKPEEFLEYWNQLDLFKDDTPYSLEKEFNPLISSLYFENYSLSKQPYLKPKLIKRKESIKLIYGDLDIKYKTYALEELSDFELEFLKDKGHRLISHYADIVPLLKEFYAV